MSEYWDKMEKETAKSYSAFCVYRDMGLSRSLDKTRLALGKEKPGYNRTLEEWSSKYEWVARATAYDAYLLREQREKAEEERLKMSERHAKQAMAIQQKIVTRLQSLDANMLSPSDLIKWLDVSVKIERLARGESTENVNQNHSGQVIQKHEDAALKELLEQDPESRELLRELYRRRARVGSTS